MWIKEIAPVNVIGIGFCVKWQYCHFASGSSSSVLKSCQSTCSSITVPVGGSTAMYKLFNISDCPSLAWSLENVFQKIKANMNIKKDSFLLYEVQFSINDTMLIAHIVLPFALSRIEF